MSIFKRESLSNLCQKRKILFLASYLLLTANEVSPSERERNNRKFSSKCMQHVFRTCFTSNDQNQTPKKKLPDGKTFSFFFMISECQTPLRTMQCTTWDALLITQSIPVTQENKNRKKVHRCYQRNFEHMFRHLDLVLNIKHLFLFIFKSIQHV